MQFWDRLLKDWKICLRYDGFWGSLLLSSLLLLSNGGTPAKAESGYREITILGDRHASFESLVNQAESAAKSTVEQAFSHNPELSELTLTVLGERNGQISVLMTTRISRSDWRQDANIQQWSEYFRSSDVLLGFALPPAYNQIARARSPQRSVASAPAQSYSAARRPTAVSQPMPFGQIADDGRGFDGDLD